MKVFMNAKGQYLKWFRAEKGGYSSGSHWRYIWVDSVHEATLATHIPYARYEKWEHDHNPKEYVIAELEATVETTRIVTLVKE